MTAIFFGYRGYKTSLKQLSFEVVNNCTSRFHFILKDLKKDPNNIDTIQAYIGLCNEEIFYFKYDYLPKDVVFEWLSGMKDTVPHFVNDENVNKSPKCIKYIHQEDGAEIDLLYGYQRLKYVFTFPDIETYQNLQNNGEHFIKYVFKRLKLWKNY